MHARVLAVVVVRRGCGAGDAAQVGGIVVDKRVRAVFGYVAVVVVVVGGALPAADAGQPVAGVGIIQGTGAGGHGGDVVVGVIADGRSPRRGEAVHAVVGHVFAVGDIERVGDIADVGQAVIEVRKIHGVPDAGLLCADARHPLAGVEGDVRDMAVGVLQLLGYAVGPVSDDIDIRDDIGRSAEGVGGIAHLPEARVGHIAQIIEGAIGIDEGEHPAAQGEGFGLEVVVGVVGVIHPRVAVVGVREIVVGVVILADVWCGARIVDMG